MDNKTNITSYLKHYGFFLPGADIYGGFAKAWDFGPNATELKKNLENLWWKYFISSSPYNVSFDSSILTSPKVLDVSGHLRNFYDWKVECLSCQRRHRLDSLLSNEDFANFTKIEKERKEISSLPRLNKCPNCKEKNFSIPQKFNLLLSTNLQVTSDNQKENIAYLRPETCQGIFINFLAIQKSTNRKLPFGVGQVGKSFRNEITLNHGIFRKKEFGQLEFEFFHLAEDGKNWWEYWTEKAWIFLQKVIINNQKKTKKINLEDEELPHYAKKTLDLYFEYHFGWGELCSNSHRGNYDLSQHSEHSREKLAINGIIPEVIEISFGLERLMLAILEDAYSEERLEDSKSTRNVLKFSPILSPYFVAVVTLSKQLKEKSYQVYLELIKESSFSSTYEEANKIGKSYRRQDAIGTYYCITVDFQTLEDNTVTIRQRDTMEQKRMSLYNIVDYLNTKYQKEFKKIINSD